MDASRRKFVAKALGWPTAAAALAGRAAAEDAPAQEPEPVRTFQMAPIGEVVIDDERTAIRVDDAYVDGLLGLEQWSHVQVFYWFDRNDLPEKRRILQVHPRGNPDNPLTGVFACRAPVRPNLIALTLCRLLEVRANLVIVEAIDAFAGTPVLDLKPFIPPDAAVQDLKVPEWARRRS